MVPTELLLCILRCPWTGQIHSLVKEDREVRVLCCWFSIAERVPWMLSAPCKWESFWCHFILFLTSLGYGGKLVYLFSCLNFLSSVYFNLCPPFALDCIAQGASTGPGAWKVWFYPLLYWCVVMPLEWAVKISLWLLPACNCLHKDSMCELALCNYEVCFLHDFWALILTSVTTSAVFSAELSVTHCPQTDVIFKIPL